MITCRLCGKNANEIGGWLKRVNEKGGPGLWECQPTCGAELSQESRLLGAILGNDEQESN